MQLREYQELLIEGVRAEFHSGKRRVCIVSPCGSGKTIIMAWMSAQSKLLGNNILFCVHRQELLSQAAETFADAGITHGIIAANIPMNLTERIQVASVQTVVRRLGKINKPQLIIFDEAQHCLASTWRKVLEAFPDAFVVGLTATPIRLGGQGLGDVFESLIIGPSVKELISWGNLAPFRCYAPPVQADFSGLRVKMGDYVQSDVALQMDRSEIIGDIIAHYQRLASGCRAICYCASIAHSTHTAEMFRQAGIPAMHIDGETHEITRKAAIADLKAGKIKVLTNVDLVGEGLNVPALDAVILARPTQSTGLYIQQAMRALRADPDNPNKTALIIDHVGNIYRHGMVDDDREWSLDGAKKKTGVKPEIPLKVCPQCYGAHKPGPVCELCGYRYPVEERAEPEQRAGELAEIIELEKRRLRQEIGRARDVVTLEQIAMTRGYKPGWVTKLCELKKIPFGGS